MSLALYAVQTAPPLIRQPQGLTPSPKFREKANLLFRFAFLNIINYINYKMLFIR